MGRRKKGDPINGWINLDKPLDMTSTQALSKVRWLLNAQKAGHAGTLDPRASGILPIALGEATKTISFAQDRIKTYQFTITWGEQRDTDDAEGQIMGTSDHRPAQTAIAGLLPEFIGEITQIPPRFSAIKIDGERAYDLARDGEEFEIKSRTVFIKSLRLLAARAESADFEATCGKGTYIRALGRDMALKLGTLGYISALRRTQVGPFAEKAAISLDKLGEMVNSAAAITDVLAGVLLPLETALDDIPALAMKEGETAKLRSGQTVSFTSKPDFERIEKAGLGNNKTALAVYNASPVALVEVIGPEIKPVRVFNI